MFFSSSFRYSARASFGSCTSCFIWICDVIDCVFFGDSGNCCIFVLFCLLNVFFVVSVMFFCMFFGVIVVNFLLMCAKSELFLSVIVMGCFCFVLFCVLLIMVLLLSVIL